MINRIKHHRQKFTTISNDIVNDDRLTWQATGVMCYLLSLPDDWRINSNEIATRKLGGRYQVLAAMKLLEECGYIRRTRARIDGGTLMTVTHVFEQSLTGSRLSDSGLSDVGLPDSGLSDAGKPRPLVKTQEQRPKKQVLRKQRPSSKAAGSFDNDDVKPNGRNGTCCLCNEPVAAHVGKLIGKMPAHRTEELCKSARAAKGLLTSSTSTVTDNAGESWKRR